MNVAVDGKYPDSEYGILNPILEAVYADIMSRNMTDFVPNMTVVPSEDPGQAYALSIYDRFAHMTFKRADPDGENVEVWFGTGGQQFGPVAWFGTMVVPQTEIAFLSFMATQYITKTLDALQLTGWSLKKFNAFYPEIVGPAPYNELLKVFAVRVLQIPELAFQTGINVVNDQSYSA